MDPSGKKGNPNNRRVRRPREESQVEMRLRMLRASEGRTLRSSNSNNSGMPRPEEAPSSMGSNSTSSRRRSSNDPPTAQESTARFAAAVAARPNRNRSSDAEDDDGNNSNSGNNNNANDNPLLANLLRHLREYCRDGDRKGPHPNAINVEKARNVLEACAGNVALAGELYYEDYFASQMREQQQPAANNNNNNNPPPLDAPSGAAAAAAAAEDPAENPDDEERHVRRRLESDFERLSVPAARSDAAEIRLSKRRRRRRQRQEAGEAPAAEAAAAAAANNNNNNNGNIPIDDARARRAAVAAAARVARPQQAVPAVANEDAAAAAVPAAGGEASVSVSDDEFGGSGGILRMVRASARNLAARTRSRRRRRSSSFGEDTNSNNNNNSSELNRAREVLYAQIAAQDEDPMEVERRKRYREAVKSSKSVRSNAPGGGGDDSGDDDDSGSDREHNNNNSDDDDAYLSENDWLFNAPRNNATVPPDAASSSASQPVQNLRAPLRILWGGLLRPPVAPTKSVKIKLEDGQEETIEKAVRASSSNVKVEDDETTNKTGDGADDDNGNNDGEAANARSSKRPEIPSTWLHASFATHATGMGLAIKRPKLEDVADHSWRLQQLGPDASATNRRSNAIPLPYHCRAMTAVLSIVTAMIYTGASIQSDQVTCSTSRIPFLELSEEERLRQFDDRLVDALSVLIFIAAKASMERKKKALRKKMSRKNRKKRRQQKKRKASVFGDDAGVVIDDEPDALQLSLERKLKLCPVAWWKENPQSVVNLPADQWQASVDDASHSGPRIQVGVSYSNLSDIRAYVRSARQSFCSPGGLALLLETIVGIHGEGAIKRMMEKARESATEEDRSKGCFLVKCSCEERQRKRLQDASERRKLMNSVDTTPPGSDCMSTELVSLLLTGKIRSSWKGWSTEQLGFGILSRTPGEVGRALTRPETPVWLLNGETCFSVLALDHTNHGVDLDEERVPKAPSDENGKKKEKKDKQYLGPSNPKAAPSMKISRCSDSSRSRDRQNAQQFAKLDQPGSIVNMLHWNCWFSVRNQSGLRLISARPKWSPPAPSWVLAHYKAAPHAQHSTSLSCVRKSVAEQLQERRASMVNVVSGDERDGGLLSDPKAEEAALERIRSNADDVKFYPNQYRMWRYDILEKEDEEIDLNSKPRGDHWTPYYSLRREDQELVERKFGPQINRILWTRWPGATIDKFTPEGKTEPLPVV